jgi:hypothetical protein
VKKLHAHEIAAMSREEALRTLATAAGVPEDSRRMAEITLAGPAVSAADEQRLRGAPMKYKRIAVAVARAYA